ANTISGNSTAGVTVFGQPAGISFALASAAVLRNARVESNNGAGVLLAGRSTLSVFSSTVTRNSANGVQLSQGSMAIFNNTLPNAPLASISGNAGVDLKCQDTESSYTGPVADSFTTDCTKF